MGIGMVVMTVVVGAMGMIVVVVMVMPVPVILMIVVMVMVMAGSAGADAFDVVVVALLGEADLGLEAQHLLAILAELDRKRTRLNSSHYCAHRMPYSA